MPFVDPQKEQRLGDGQLYNNLLRLGISNTGLVGGLGQSIFDGINQLACDALGPGLLQIILDKSKDCPGGILLSEFKSTVDFCQYFNSAPANKQKCMTDAAILYKSPSIYRFNIAIAKCCAQCAKNGR